MNNPLITARSLHKTYSLGRRSLEVLCGVNLTVDRGEFLALRGTSGAGKSTLLHLLGGLDTPNAGEIVFDGRSLSSLSNGGMAVFRNRSVGFIFQSYHLLPELDALENVCLPARMARINADDCAARASTLLERVGLKDRLDHKPYELSGGEQQRVAIARALINEPVLVLADEPTGNLDSHTGEGIIELLCSIQREQHATLIVATHDANIAARAPRVIHLIDGRIEADGTAK
jgi:lipoprotein-releasing system ATP-binding protein